MCQLEANLLSLSQKFLTIQNPQLYQILLQAPP
nr:MAG TPA: hypothetical protein [Bacteriophage sp.]